ncbi:hypothetical protein GA0074696_0415 [Micromonospora purpureochromogenes]|uniref:Uncharacterized protein n=1 Tax=Micromonospora purpureochromogenes TaxID=47872 RepID=A0A1C4UJC9_9ACTN|nr:hypothetical protein [Micromonospora purpureochromogenes]SCE71780.1 hypothetical protein GA0074696_0415 [Micromonospora purpureochromogenes]
MSYPDQAPARRPAAVTLAAAVLGLMALAAGAYAVAALLALGGTVDRLRSAAAGTTAGPDDVDGVVTLLRVTTILSAVLTVLVGLLLIGLAAGLLAGRRGARVATWVVAGLGLLCGCCGLAALVGQRAGPLRTDEQSTVELLGLLGDAYPSWWLPLNGALSVGQVLGYLVVAVLLALPAANGWFGRARPTPPPPPAPVPYGPYPPPQAPPPSR